MFSFTVRASILLYIAILIYPAACQQDADMYLAPDVRFNDENDRFDIGPILNYQQAAENNEYAMQGRRHNRYTYSIVQPDARRQIKRSNYAYHDNMVSDDDGGIEEFTRNLNAYRSKEPLLQKSRRHLIDLFSHMHRGYDQYNGLSRRMMSNGRRVTAEDMKADLLMHYAVPFDMKVKGYLQPLTDK